jgi:biopolymer transport protein TolR
MAFGAPHPGEGDEPVIADINVTPLVDVMLVLLIIFMITAPMLHQGVEVALPQTQADNLPLRSEDPLVLSINRDGVVYVQDAPVHPSQLIDRLLPLLRARGDDAVFLKGDRDVPYGTVVQVLDVLHRGGIHHIGMVTERPRSARQ